MSFQVPLAAAPGAPQSESPADFVHSDVAALEAHMRDCAQSRGRLFKLRGGLQTVHSMAAGRLVTLACVAVVLTLGLISVV